MKTLALILALSVAGCASDFDAGGGVTGIQGGYDPGGRIGAYAALVDEFNAGHTAMRISGLCVSACTMKLGIGYFVAGKWRPNVCVEPTAVLGFHHVLPGVPWETDAEIGKGEASMESRIGMAFPRFYASIAGRGFFKDTEIHTITGREAIALGVPGCK